MQTPFYWTSTTNEGFIDYAWYVDMRDGKVEYNPKDYEQYYIWCVRDPHQITGGQHKNYWHADGEGKIRIPS